MIMRIEVDYFKDGEFVYYCKVEGGRGKKMCVGCQAPSGQELYDGDRYFKVSRR